jgi:virulence-associated protein VagC
MSVHETKTYRSGKQVALRLPRSLSIPPGETMLVRQEGDLIVLRRIRNRARVTRKLRALVRALEAIGYPGPQGPRAFATRRGC